MRDRTLMYCRNINCTIDEVNIYIYSLTHNKSSNIFFAALPSGFGPNPGIIPNPGSHPDGTALERLLDLFGPNRQPAI